MPRPNKSINQREKEICERFQTVRKEIAKWSQFDLANEMELTQDQLANVEYKRAPLRFGMAKFLCERFGISLRWLALGTLPVKFDFGVSMEYGDSIDKSTVFSGVFDKYLDEKTDAIERDLIQKIGEANFRSGQFDEKIVVDLVKVGRAPAMAAANYVRKIITVWLNWLPEDLRLVYVNALLQANADFHSEYKEEINRALPPSERKESQAVEQFSKTPLTLEAKTLTNESVKPVLPKLIERLKKATQERGSKVELANWLGVHRQSVTDWLSGKQEPGGEITLKMLHWVEQKERQK